MAMVSMKTDDSMPDVSESNSYGYGLRICLNDDQCEALGIKTPLQAGSRVMLSAMAFVAEATASVEDDGDDKGPDVSMHLQITDLELKPAQRTSQELASAMYDSKD